MGNPSGTPTPPPSIPPEVLQEFLNQYTSGQSSDNASRDLLRLLNEEFGLGLEIPVTLGELLDAAEALYKARSDYLSSIDPLQSSGGGFTFQDRIDPTREAKMATYRQAEDALMSLAAQYRGGQGAQAVTAILRPPRPSIEQIPTAEQFTSEFNNAFAMYRAEVRQQIGPTGLAGLDAHKGDIYSQYLNALGNYARFGVSPFELKEISPLTQPGAGAGEAAANEALKKALGEGVQDVTRLTGTGESVSTQAQEIGSGVPRQFAAFPRVSPLDFLRKTYTPQRLSLIAATPTGEDVRRGQQERGGMVIEPTRIG